MGFHNVLPVTVKVRDLSLSIERSTPFLEKIHFRRRSQPTEIKRILQHVCLDIPAGSLMAIIGASGSGKVYTCCMNVLTRLHY
jgi:ABC-type transporter Mla maintaining outer membrane lipid asymmetry ATPase subunit MlaF